LHASYGRTATPPWAIDGGTPGSLNGIEVVRGKARRWLARPSDFPLDRGDCVRICTGGGGGWGEPHARDPESVAHDVRDGLIAAADATAIYGVVTDPGTQKADREATEKLRAKFPGAAQ
jgi:N-methylhydantoinase B